MIDIFRFHLDKESCRSPLPITLSDFGECLSPGSTPANIASVDFTPEPCGVERLGPKDGPSPFFSFSPFSPHSNISESPSPSPTVNPFELEPPCTPPMSPSPSPIFSDSPLPPDASHCDLDSPPLPITPLNQMWDEFMHDPYLVSLGEAMRGLSYPSSPLSSTSSYSSQDNDYSSPPSSPSDAPSDTPFTPSTSSPLSSISQELDEDEDLDKDTPVYHLLTGSPTGRAPKEEGEYFPCAYPGCSIKPFGRCNDMKRHLNSVHLKSGAPCPFCGRSLTRKDAVRRHCKSKGCPVLTSIRQRHRHLGGKIPDTLTLRQARHVPEQHLERFWTREMD
ncbi:hypothetical protein BDZ89DRAFT_781275 [Hymenopellis radicata]|nr:hypothetical protein BDZ89DRAFT_781275 [Hymenopellis radicata]